MQLIQPITVDVCWPGEKVHVKWKPSAQIERKREIWPAQGECLPRQAPAVSSRLLVLSSAHLTDKTNHRPVVIKIVVSLRFLVISLKWKSIFFEWNKWNLMSVPSSDFRSHHIVLSAQRSYSCEREYISSIRINTKFLLKELTDYK